jgi:hypothetical protein
LFATYLNISIYLLNKWKHTNNSKNLALLYLLYTYNGVNSQIK